MDRRAMMVGALILLLEIGCASVGNKFDYEDVGALELGEMRASDYRETFGDEPTVIEDRDTSEGKYKIVRYNYANANLASARSRLLILEFKDGLLNAYVYISSFGSDQTKFAWENIDQIEEGRSSQSAVLEALGKPQGKARCPSLLEDYKERCQGGTEIWSYMTAERVSTLGAAYRGRRPEMKTVFVTFDQDGTVVEVSRSKVGG